MKRKWLIVVIPALFFIFSIAVMAGGSILKKPLGEDDRVLEGVQKLEKHVEDKEWEQAEKDIDYVNTAWSKVVNRIQFSTERELMFEVSGTLARLKGGVEIQDDKAVMEEVYYFYDLWKNLGT